MTDTQRKYMGMLKDQDVAERLQLHQWGCEIDFTGKCTCDWADRVYNTFVLLRTIRATERKACEEIAREVGSARAADRIRDREKDDAER